jgi:UDP-N-acetylglucosamine:LPS N-acetylglucosamine transferase
MRRILAVASGGGHWQQLMQMRPAFAECDVSFATTIAGLPEQFSAFPAAIVPDCSRDTPFQVPRCAWAIWWLIRKSRPDVVISTGALPGVIALALARRSGARTIWVDSVANAEEMSASGRLARRFADEWLTQWPHVAEATGATYAGSVL